MSDILIIFGSARGDGRTAVAVNRLRQDLALSESRIVDLSACRIEPFQYRRSAADDFPAIVDAMLRHRHVIFATPVYWYAMSGVMKIFFDRLTDLLDQEKRAVGRALAGRNMWLLATGTDESLPSGFIVPFQRTAEYFAMSWREAFYVAIDDRAAPDAQDFGPVRNLAAALTKA